jgi:hypothetical protein
MKPAIESNRADIYSMLLSAKAKEAMKYFCQGCTMCSSSLLPYYTDVEGNLRRIVDDEVKRMVEAGEFENKLDALENFDISKIDFSSKKIGEHRWPSLEHQV